MMNSHPEPYSLLLPQIRAEFSQLPIELLLILLGIISAVSIALAIYFDIQMRQDAPSLRSYRWGFFNGIMLILAPLLYLSGPLYFLQGYGFLLPTLTEILLCAPLIALGMMIVGRQRWAFALWVGISFLPPVWVINLIYLSRRWDECKAETNASADAMPAQPSR